MAQQNEISCYKRYKAAARRFELIGAAIFAAGALLGLALGGAKLPVILCCAIGLCVFVVGTASMQPHNAVKSFALQCAQEPAREYAQGLLDALESHRRIRMTAQSIRMTERAIVTYACSDGADKELAERLAAALRDRVARKYF